MSAIDRVIDLENTKLCRIQATLWVGNSSVYDLRPLAMGQGFSGVPVYSMNGERIGTANLIPDIDAFSNLMYRMTASIDYHTPDRLSVETGEKLFATMNFILDTDSPMTSRTLDLCRPIKIKGLTMVTVTLGLAAAFDGFTSPWSGTVRLDEVQNA